MSRPNRHTERYCVEDRGKWREMWVKAPFFELPRGWKIAVVPPFNGAAARFRIKVPNKGYLSIYLDTEDALGCVGEPYWELHPSPDGECERFMLADIDGLTDCIKRSGRALEKADE